MGIEVPKLVEDLKIRFKDLIQANQLTILTKLNATIDFTKSEIKVDNLGVYSISPVGNIAQELVLTGGLEAWVLKKLQK